MKRAKITGALVLTIALLPLWSAWASADEVFYRGRDATGTPVNSDRPPPQGTDYEVISTSSSMVRPVDAREGAVPLKVEPTVSNDFQPVAAKPPTVAKNPEYCARARYNLLQIDNHGQTRLRDDQGDVRYLTPDEKEAQRKDALEAIKIYCD